MIESAMPAFANVGDKIILRAVVHNTTDTGGNAEVLLEVDDRVRAAERSRQITLAPHQSLAIDLPIEVLATGTSKWRWAVKFTPANGTDALGDAVEAKIKLNYPAPLIRQVETRRIEGETRRTAAHHRSANRGGQRRRQRQPNEHSRSANCASRCASCSSIPTAASSKLPRACCRG